MIPANAPVKKAVRRPNFFAIHPTGKVPAAIPTTKIEIGNVARPLSGASTDPTMAAVAKMTVAFAPASAVAVAVYCG